MISGKLKVDFCIIFDLDGTLIDSREDLSIAVNLMRKDFGLDFLPVETITSYVGNGTRKLVERSLAGTSVDIERAIPLMKQHYLEHLTDRTTLYDGVAEGLAELHSMGVPLAVITNKPFIPCKKILDHHKLLDVFGEVIGGDSGFPLKPEPESLLHTIRKFSAPAATSWILGDNYTDMESGRRAGIRRCFAKYGFGWRGDETPDAEVASFADFVDFVRSRLSH